MKSIAITKTAASAKSVNNGKNSLIIIPERTADGESSYRGNINGAVIEAILKDLRNPKKRKPMLVVDACEGSGTTRDVCERLGIDYLGFDLRDGFDMTSQSLRVEVAKHRPDRPDVVIAHLPYHDMIRYSGEVWGSKPVEGDLSRCNTPTEFLLKSIWALQNLFQALGPKGILIVIIGEQRSNGSYLSYASFLAALEILPLKAIWIKGQFNCRSNFGFFPKGFRPIAHENILVFQKGRKLLQMGDKRVVGLPQLPPIGKEALGYWRDVVESLIRLAGGAASIDEMYALAEALIVSDNQNLRAKLRQTANWWCHKKRDGRYVEKS